MARRRDRLDRVAAPLEPLAVGEHRVGRIIAVVGGVEARRPVGARRERGRADDPRARRRAEPLRAGAVIAMGMGYENGLDLLAFDGGEQRREMQSSSGPGSTTATAPSPTI